jgi:MerR family transcriptional regulator, light-induced transcriptional regulator
MSAEPHGNLRIGELAHRTGVSPELLRAWERRYGLLKPARSSGGFRLYSAADEGRVQRMKAHLASGVAAAEAARLADRAIAQDPSARSIGSLKGDLARALDNFDEPLAHRILDTSLNSYSLDTVISELLIPYLNNLGERWERGAVTVAQEHFATNLIRNRAMSLGRSWDAGYGPRALLACPEGELHDLGIILFGVALGERGWRITFLGANTPLDAVVSTARQMNPDAVVIAVTDPTHLAGNEEQLAALARASRLILAGRGADGYASAVGADLYETDPVAAAERLAATPSGATAPAGSR